MRVLDKIDNKLNEAKKIAFKEKAKKGDYIQSFHSALDTVSIMHGAIIGKVYKVEKDEQDGVEYVHYKADFETREGIMRKISGDFRAPQNGTPTMMGGTTVGIQIIK